MVCMALLFKMVFFTGRAGFLSSFYEGSCRRLRTYGFLNRVFCACKVQGVERVLGFKVSWQGVRGLGNVRWR